MREIKFRAWDIAGQIMLYPGDHPFCITTHGTPVYNNYRLGFRLMQFTGLRDKNGTEIYEGDIIEITHPREGEECSVIVFDNDRGRFAWKEPDSGVLYGLTSDDDANKVIGNIYQHPELLRSETNAEAGN